MFSEAVFCHAFSAGDQRDSTLQASRLIPVPRQAQSTTMKLPQRRETMATAKKAKAKSKPAAHKAAKAKAPAKKAAAARKPAAKHAPKAPARTGGDSYSKYSGKFTVRLPKSLHQLLVDRAEKEGVSLNLFVTNALSRTVGGASGGKGKR
jgi:hypothetical protein